jgi:hypothetical protein
MSSDNAYEKSQTGAGDSSDRARFDAELKSRREAAQGDPDKLKLYEMVAKVGEKNPAAASRIFDVFDASPLAESKLLQAVRGGTLEKLDLITPNSSGVGALAEYNVLSKTLSLPQTLLTDRNPETRDMSLVFLAQTTAHEGQHAVEGNQFKKALEKFDADVNKTIDENRSGPRDHTRSVATLLDYKRTAEATAEIEAFNASAEALKKKAEKEGKPFDLGYMYESYKAAGDTRMSLYIQKEAVEGKEGVYTYSMKPGIQVDENLKIKQGNPETVEAFARNYFDYVSAGIGMASSGATRVIGYPENYTAGILDRVHYIETQRGQNYPGSATIIVNTSQLPEVLPEYVKPKTTLTYTDPSLDNIRINGRINQDILDSPIGKPGPVPTASAADGAALAASAPSAQTNERTTLLSQSATALQASGIAKDLDTQQRANLEAGVARVAQDNKMQQIAGVTQGANGQAIVYDGTSDHARRAAFDPKALGQTPADVSIAQIDRNANQTVAQNNETKQRSSLTV